MNYLDDFSKILTFNNKKRKDNTLRNIAVLTVLGVAIAGTIAVLLAESCGKEIRNMVIKKADAIDDDINRDEIKQTLEMADDESIGDVGIAMENALEDLEEDKQN